MKPADRPFLPDRIVGGLMLAVFTAWNLWWVWRTRGTGSEIQDEYIRRFMGTTALGYTSLFLNYIVQFIYSVGVILGQRWVFAIVALTTARMAVEYLETLSGGRSTWDSQAMMGFLILIFLYCGLRLMGPLGPRLDKLLPARDEARFLDEPDEPSAKATQGPHSS